MNGAKRIAAAAGVALFALLAACGNDAKKIVVGKWDVDADVKDSLASQFSLEVQINKDGTFAVSGGRNFEAVAGMREIKGTYEFTGDYAIHVKMDKNPFNYQETEFSMKINSKNEIILTPPEGDYTVTLKRTK